jgi:hypothetical protein
MRGLLLATCLLAGCDSLAGGDYVGEPMFTLSGTLSSKGSASNDHALGLSLMWQDSGGAGGPGIAASPVPVSLEFPATLRVSIALPPPDAARFGFDDSPAELAEAYLVIVGTDAEVPRQMRGIDRSHVLVWASGDIAEGGQAADYLGGPVSAGYHLRRYVPAITPGSAQQRMIDRCVASGASPAACTARRAYQLAAIADDDELRIVVTP